MEKTSTKNNPKILITGGAGFLGKAIVREFLSEDSLVRPSELRVFDLKKAEGADDPRLIHIIGDILDQSALDKACEGIDLVIHSAAIVDWGTHPEEHVYAVNYKGTENVIKACRQNNVGALIYTSSLDVVFTGKPLVNIDENQEYAPVHANMYCTSKHHAEELVNKENGNGLKTCSLRPADIYGEGDPFHVESLINMAKSGFYVRLGNGKAKTQHVYSGNMAYAHVKCAEAMLNGNHEIAGKYYFITDSPGSNFFKFFDHIVERAGYRIRPKNIWIPRGLAYSIGAISEMAAFMFRPIKHYNPKLSRFAVTYTCTEFTFSADKAARDFGYKPKYSQEEAIGRVAEFYKRK